MNNIKISILMAVYNEEKYISEAIESVLKQTYSNFELIIVDDCSNDNTCKIAESYLSDVRLQLYKSEKIGKVKAFNLAFLKSSGDFICFFSGDDILTKNSLSKRIRSIKNIINNPAISFCKLKTFSKFKQFNNVIVPKSPYKGALSGGTMMFNREFSQLTFPIPEILINEDQWQVLHSIYYPNIIIKHEPIIGAYYRIHKNNSLNKFESFKKHTISISKRSLVYNVFFEKYKNILTVKDKASLKSIILAEELRHKGKFLEILFIKNLNLTKKIKFIIYSNQYFYYIRKKFFSLLSGWE